MRQRLGFTLIELLVVMAIIGLLAALVFPAIGGTMGRAQATASLSNLRQWGTAIQMAGNEVDGWLPWDGMDAVSQCITIRQWWAHALPPYVRSPSYLDINRASQGRSVPLPPNRSIFVDPAAKKPTGAPYRSGQFSFFFCYVMNSKLNSALPAGSRLKIGRIERPTATAIMLEMRTIPTELPSSDPFYGSTLDRAKADWQRFANRHDSGGHIAFADGSARHVAYTYATQTASGDYNKDKLIWNPLGPAN